MFLCGPAIRHGKENFCFIYKYRQRFAVVAKPSPPRLAEDRRLRGSLPRVGHVPRRPLVLRQECLTCERTGKPAHRSDQVTKICGDEFRMVGANHGQCMLIVSVFVYGISSTGDWLQLGAASCWMVANLATLAGAEA